MKDSKNKKDHNVFYITHKLELLIWLIIVCVFIVFLSFSFAFKSKAVQDYNIFMPDVDGLIVGSPVRMMGIEVGHVTKIKPIKDEVFVRFIITKKGITIPQGTQATVEFSGMAGSKSLELYLPDETTYIDESVPLLAVLPPKRLQDAAGLLNEMFRKLGSIIKTSSYFGAQLKTIELPKGSKDIESMEKFLQYINESIDKATIRAENLRRNLENARKK